MLMVVIYDHPRDLPDHWVVRTWEVRAPSNGAGGSLTPHGVALLFNDVERARAYVMQEFPGFVMVQGEGDDPDPVVFEVYA